MTTPKVGPDHDTAFFEEVKGVFERNPEASKKYSIQYIGRQVDVMKIDFANQIGIANFSNGQLVTRFAERNDALEEMLEADRFCCAWERVGNKLKCIQICG